jgi:hypothetical protein
MYQALYDLMGIGLLALCVLMALAIAGRRR